MAPETQKTSPIFSQVERRLIANCFLDFMTRHGDGDGKMMSKEKAVSRILLSEAALKEFKSDPRQNYQPFSVRQVEAIRSGECIKCDYKNAGVKAFLLENNYAPEELEECRFDARMLSALHAARALPRPNILYVEGLYRIAGPDVEYLLNVTADNENPYVFGYDVQGVRSILTNTDNATTLFGRANIECNSFLVFYVASKIDENETQIYTPNLPEAPNYGVATGEGNQAVGAGYLFIPGYESQIHRKSIVDIEKIGDPNAEPNYRPEFFSNECKQEMI
ncbi:MAG: hypothetical protein AAGC95_11295 [Pseudomonadota bacterium]